MDITLRPMTQEERLYTYTQSSQIGSQTGNVGHLRADMGSNGAGFYSTWFDCRSDLKSDEFKEEFDGLINSLREEGAPLHNRYALSAYCYRHPEAASEDFRDFFFRADTADYAYMFRLRDGVKTRVIFPNGEVEEKSVRYIAGYAVLIRTFRCIFYRTIRLY